MKKTFTVEMNCVIDISIDESVLKRVADKSMPYDFASEQDIANHIAYNMVVNQACLSLMDGFADMDDNLAQIDYIDWELDS